MTPPVLAQPELADFGLVRMRGVGGKAIRAGQWLYNGVYRDLEHAFIYVGDGKIVEAMPGGAQLADLSEYDLETVYWSTGKISGWVDETRQREAIAAAARGYIGVPYSWLDYGAMAAHRVHLPVPGLQEYVASSGHMVCSQLVDQCYLDGGMHLFTDNRWPGYVAPSSLYELLESSG